MQPNRIQIGAMEAGLNRSIRKTGQNSRSMYQTDAIQIRGRKETQFLNTRKHKILQKQEPKPKDIFGTIYSNLFLCQGLVTMHCYSAAFCLTWLGFHYSKNNLLLLLIFFFFFITTGL